jgi:hypothetical protein
MIVIREESVYITLVLRAGFLVYSFDSLWMRYRYVHQIEISISSKKSLSGREVSFDYETHNTLKRKYHKQL